MIVRTTIKPWLKEYAQFRFGVHARARDHNLLGILIRPLLSVMPKDYKDPSVDPNELLTMDVSRDLCINCNMVAGQRIYLTPDNQYYFEHIVKKLFGQDVFSYIDNNLKHNSERSSGIKAAIKEMCKSCNITYSEKLYNNLQKEYHRNIIHEGAHE